VWSYKSDAIDPGTAWRQPAFDASAWATGRSQLGWGNRGETTVVPSGVLTQHYRRSFTVGDPGALGPITLRVKRDDGIAVYLNGTEVMRNNLPAGTLTAGTYSSTKVTAADGITWYEFTVPASALVAGTNVVAAEVHQDARSDTRSVFDLELRASGGTPPPVTPVVAITTPAAGTWVTSASTVLTGTCTAAAGTVTVAVTGAQAASATAPCTADAWTASVPLADGAYSTTASQTVGATTGSSAARAFSVDTTAPVIAPTFPVAAASYNAARWNAGCTTAGICGTATDAGSGIPAVGVRIQRSSNNQYWNGSAWQTTAVTLQATGTTAWSRALPTSALSNGVTYTVTVTASDTAGNAATAATRSFTYDTSGPTTSGGNIVTSNKNGAVAANDSFAVTFGEALDPTTVPATATLSLTRSNGTTSYAVTGLTNGNRSTGSTGYLTSSSTTRTVSYAGTLTLGNGNRTVTFRVTGACSGSCTAVSSTASSGAIAFVANPALRDLAGNAPTTSSVSTSSTVMF
jgi:hypothetical protein